MMHGRASGTQRTSRYLSTGGMRDENTKTHRHSAIRPRPTSSKPHSIPPIVSGSIAVSGARTAPDRMRAKDTACEKILARLPGPDDENCSARIDEPLRLGRQPVPRLPAGKRSPHRRRTKARPRTDRPRGGLGTCVVLRIWPRPPSAAIRPERGAFSWTACPASSTSFRSRRSRKGSRCRRH